MSCGATICLNVCVVMVTTYGAGDVQADCATFLCMFLCKCHSRKSSYVVDPRYFFTDKMSLIIICIVTNNPLFLSGFSYFIPIVKVEYLFGVVLEHSIDLGCAAGARAYI